MKARHSLLPALLALALPVAAADFTINVPVEMHSLQPDITRLRVNCLVQNSINFTNNPYLNIGTGLSAPQAVVNGELNGTFVVQINAFSGKDPALAKGYRCDLHMEAGGNWFIAQTNPNYPLDPGKPAKTIVTGLIPQ